MEEDDEDGGSAISSWRLLKSGSGQFINRIVRVIDFQDLFICCVKKKITTLVVPTEHLLFHSELHAPTKYVVIRSSPTPLTHICCAPINHCHAVCKLWPTNQDMVIVASLWAHGTNHLKATPTQPYMVVKRRVSVFMYPPPRVPSPPTLLLFTRPSRVGIQF